MSIEQVLVIPRSTFDKVGSFQGFEPASALHLSEYFAPGVAQFIPRPDAENDPSFKQLIPYCVLVHEGKVVRYQRGKSGGEKRLTAQYSIGIGGHINPIDSITGTFDIETYQKAVERELNEEIEFEGETTPVSIGLINDDTNPVGRVHLGVVEIFNLHSPIVKAREDAIANLELISQEQLHEEIDLLETWSKIAVENLHRVAPQLFKKLA
jgi:predicted NUDIX family phosphoesterase